MNFRMFWRPKLILCKIGMIEKSWNFHTVRCYVKLIFQIWSQKLHFVSFLRHKIRMAEYSQNFFADADDFMEKTCLGCHIQYLFSRAPLVGSLDMDYWCSAFWTKGARLNTGYGTPNMFLHLKQKLSRITFWFNFDIYKLCSRKEVWEKF